jgi:hypothetical protein
MKMAVTINFTVLGANVRYEINDTGTHEELWFDDISLVDSSGDLGVFGSREWKNTLLLSGSARAASQRKILKDHAEFLLSEEIRSIPEIYKSIEKG